MRFIQWLAVVIVCAALICGCSKLTRENYEKIEMGMTYDQVVEIIGQPDTCDAAMGAKQCIWGDKDKNITIGFMGDNVILPSMTGL
ncbi:MAG: DUF3862 domain-containing protein [Desulfobacter sp.]|nr:MAG: DUF3862 domain-containing protein [Desulfobacter sp.]